MRIQYYLGSACEIHNSMTYLQGFAVSLFAIWMSSREATPKHTFGYHRSEILGALVSMLMIWAITGVLVYEAINRCDQLSMNTVSLRARKTNSRSRPPLTSTAPRPWQTGRGLPQRGREADVHYRYIWSCG